MTPIQIERSGITALVISVNGHFTVTLNGNIVYEDTIGDAINKAKQLIDAEHTNKEMSAVGEQE